MQTTKEDIRENIISILSEITCGEGCWHAKELVCKCSCGGKNHGCLKTLDGVMPIRTAKLDGVMYELKAVGSYGELYSEAKKINEAYPRKPVPYPCESGFIVYAWGMNDYNAPARLKTANAVHVNKWPELSAYKDLKPWEQRPYVLWVRLSRDDVKVA